MMKIILPLESLPYSSSSNHWTDPRLSLILRLVLQFGPKSVVIAQTWFPLTWRKPAWSEDWGTWIMVSKDKILGGVNFKFRMSHTVWFCIFNNSHLKHAHLNFWREKICRYETLQSKWTLKIVYMLLFIPNKREELRYLTHKSRPWTYLNI